MPKTEVVRHRFDALVVGAGGAGLYAALELAKAKINFAVITKLYPTRSHTGAAQGGIGAALGNLEEDSPLWHAFDTVKGGDYLCDQDAVEYMCQAAVETVLELEHMGLPFSRTPEGKIAQRRFGGHTRNYGQGPVRRSCYAADRTGHMILQTLYQNCIKRGVPFFDEFHVVDLIVSDGAARGVVAYEIKTGGLHIIEAKAVVFATGGSGRMFSITSNAHALTGDGMAIALMSGVPLQDMEFFQFHPTGIYKLGILLSEAARGEGGILKNGKGERFMERYSPKLLDLAPRDIVSRCIYLEVREGRGVQGKDYVHLDLTHIGRKVLDEKLPDITEFVRTYMGLEPATDMVPVQPTAHYAMGGVPTDKTARVLAKADGTKVKGFYAAGECACVSVHGGNRLGTNSLVDILVFGRQAGRSIVEDINQLSHEEIPDRAANRAAELFSQFKTNAKNPAAETVGKIREEMRRVMTEHCGVFRTAQGLTDCVSQIEDTVDRLTRARIFDTSATFNTDLLEAVELHNLLRLAWVTSAGAKLREESRGAHSREDFPKRNDAQWLKHTFCELKDGKLAFSFKPVTITQFQPQERKY
ncbi:MAG: succinate dehydrogenase flavoprotein subunit [Elusimicrobia bacterium]|nr:succinate dehydrogenase flavoprotein subunit [Elusimicrobiota bacterium]